MLASSDIPDNIPDDVLCEIFRRIPFKSIFKFKNVSKRWNSRLSNPKLRLHSLTPWIFFHQHNRPVNKFVLTSTSLDIHSQTHDGFSFRLPGNQPFGQSVSILASSNGLVLLSESNTYYVFNPITKKYVALPPSKNICTDMVLSGLICQSSYSPELSSKITFKVVRIQELGDPSTNFDLEIYSSNKGKWKTYKVSCPQEVTILPRFSCNVASSNKVLYWIEGQGNRIIAYNRKIKENGVGLCRLIDVPGERQDHDYRCLGESEGFISYSECNSGQLSIWVLEDDWSNKVSSWRLVHTVKVKDMLLAENCWLNQRLALSNDTVDLKPLAFNPVDRSVVILAYCSVSYYSYSYNMRTRRLEALSREGTCYCTCSMAPFVLVPWPTKF